MPSPRINNSSPGRYHCSTCGKDYSSNSHLRRHEATHFTRHALLCPFCDRDFSRA
ncbi:hypothetical protein F5884DRAFT_804060 [Xylogone sp. PMI_703]|nr:hypothetical protein F5884DRAFT_804060 [Xylogone sp. PMI_703]